MMTIRKASERGHANHAWLDTYYTFSFADYYDPAWMGSRNLRAINDDTVAPTAGFGEHAHRDMEIITYILDGALEHRDSMGNGRVIKPGEFQYMAAGTGVRHSEYNPSKREAVHPLQIWIEPDKPGCKPAYAEKSCAVAPPDRLQLVAGNSGRENSIRIHQCWHRQPAGPVSQPCVIGISLPPCVRSYRISPRRRGPEPGSRKCPRGACPQPRALPTGSCRHRGAPP